MDIQYYRTIARKVLEGVASNEEKAALEAFMEAHSDDPSIMQALLPLQELQETAEQPLPPGMEERVMFNVMGARPARRMGRIAYWSRVAAAAAVVIFVCSLVYRWARPGKFAARPQLQYVSVVTQPGQQKSIALPDGSRILLNGGSQVRFPQDFGNTPREVYLEGEAFFTVSRDSLRPFVVHAPAISTTVLGTSFNVRCFNSEDLSRVSVATGKVKVALTDSAATGNRELYVTPGQQASYSRHNPGGLRKETVDIAAIGGWKERSFFYAETPLRQILADLQGAYGLQFKVTDAAVLNCTYTATFRNLPAKGILQTLSTLGNVKFKQANNQIEVSGKPCQ